MLLPLFCFVAFRLIELSSSAPCNCGQTSVAKAQLPENLTMDEILRHLSVMREAEKLTSDDSSGMVSIGDEELTADVIAAASIGEAAIEESEETEKGGTAIEESKKEGTVIEESEEEGTAIEESQKEEAAIEEPRKEGAAIEESNKERTVSEEFRKEATTIEESRKEEESKNEETVIEEFKKGETTIEDSKKEEAAIEDPRKEKAAIEESKKENTIIEESKKEQTVTEESKKEETTIEESKKEETVIEESRNEEVVIEESEKTDVAIEESKKSTKATTEQTGENSVLEPSERTVTADPNVQIKTSEADPSQSDERVLPTDGQKEKPNNGSSEGAAQEKNESLKDRIGGLKERFHDEISSRPKSAGTLAGGEPVVGSILQVPLNECEEGQKRDATGKCRDAS